MIAAADWLAAPAGRTLAIEVLRGAERRDVSVTTAELLPPDAPLTIAPDLEP